ncbi:hypothetical protein [Rothia kristinae]|uniref:hypothetical protein n=1 Tax=Rothia kristinae TaxID=37923 RepID=UPI0022E24FC1|nr:hypothetical protein [Rothia kristinae]
MELSDYLTETTGLSLRRLASRASMQASKLQRQLSGTTVLTMETLRDVARGTGLDMLDLFARANLITTGEASTLRAAGSLSAASDEDLALEMLRRTRRNPTSPINQPIGKANLSVPPATVHNDPTHYALAAKKHEELDVNEEDYL